jgi:hypothetical protein
MPTITDTALHIFNRWRILDIHRNNVNGYAVDASSPGKPPVKDANSMVLAKMQKCLGSYFNWKRSIATKYHQLSQGIL